MKKIFLVLSFFLILFSDLSAQVDTEFWFAAPYVYIPSGRAKNIYFGISTYDEAATVTISQPKNPQFQSTKITVEANSFEKVDLTRWMYTYIEHNEFNKVLNKGILITSTTPISVYYAIDGNESEIYSLKGKNALGYDFIVPSQYQDKENHTDARSSIEIVATEDKTKVTITPYKACDGGRPANVPFDILLDRGESYAIRAASNTPGSQLRNTIIKSDKPIAVNTSDCFVNVTGGANDPIGDQLVPLPLVGSEYVAVAGNEEHKVAYFFYVDEYGGQPCGETKIYANNFLLTTLSPTNREFVFNLPANSAMLFTSDNGNPYIVFQVIGIRTGNGIELGGTMLPRMTCTGSTEVTYMPMGSEQVKVALVTETANIHSFNNSSIIDAKQFKQVANSEWSYGLFSLPSLNKPFRIKNSSGVFHMSVSDNWNSKNLTYGYFSNYNSVPLVSKTGVSHYIVGDEITIVVPDANDYTNITVTLPDGTVHHSTPPFEDNIVLRLPNVDKSYEGEYRIDAQGGVCDVEPDYIQVSVYELPVPQDLSMCLGDALSISSPGYGPYQWKGDGEFGNTKTIEFIPTKGDTTYQVTVTSQQPGINIVSDGDFENRETDKINSDYTYLAVGTLSPGQYAIGSNPQSYHSAYIKHGDHTSGYGNQMIVNSSGNESTIWRQTLRGLIPGNMYEFSAWFLGVNPAASPVNIKYKMDGLFVNERDDQGELITDPEGNYYEVPQYTVEQDQEWHQLKYGFKAENSIADISIVLVETPGGSAVSVDDIRLSPLYTMPDTFNIHVQDSLHPVLKGSPYICQGIATVGLEESYDSYEWSNGQTTPEATFSSTGEYSVQVTRGECQRGTLVFTINPSAKVSVTVEDVPEFCLGSDYVDFPLTVTEGSLGYYSLHFDESAQSAHFQDLEMNESGEDYIRIPIPVNALPGTYKMTLDVYEAGCQGKGDVLPGSEIEFTLKYGSDIIAQRWNDVLSVKSSDYTNGESFSGYQWYRNGEALPGETRPYYYNNSEFTAGDCYSVTLTREDGTEVSSCEYCPEHIDAVLESTVSPVSLVNSSASLSLPSEDGVEGKAYIRDMNGGLITVQSYTGDSPEITAPSQQGVYVLEMVSDKDYRKYKIVVK